MIKIIKDSKNLDDLLDGIFNTSIGDILGSDFVNTQPSANIVEDDKQFVISLAIPGFKKENIALEVKEDHLRVSATSADEANVSDESVKWTRREFDFSSFKRSFKLPNSIDQEAISATYKNGVLTVELKKKDVVVNGPQSITIS